jgi:hypothetical protein
MSYFSDHLKDVLTKRGITAYGLGKLTGLNKQYCYKLIDGIRTPEDDTLEKIAASDELALPLPTLKGWRAIDTNPSVLKLFTENPTSIEAFADLFHMIKASIGREPTLQEMALIIDSNPVAIEPLYMEYRNIALGSIVNSGPIEMKGSKPLSREEIFSLLDQLPIEALEVALKKRFGQDFKLVKVDQPQ